MIYCQKCGTENSDGISVCRNCGEVTNNIELKKTSRTVELILGIMGGIFGLIGGVFALMFSAFAPSVGSLGISAVLVLL